MEYISEEKLDFIEDCKEKKSIARGAKSRCGHAGRRGPIMFPSDNLTKKQKTALNGECKTYRMGAPMDWDTFIFMPMDLQIEYIKSLRKKFRVPDYEIADMFGVDTEILQFQFKTINLRTNDVEIFDVIKWTKWRGEEI